MWHKIESNHLFSGGVFCSKYFSNALAGSNIVYGWLGGFYWTISYLCFQIFLGLNYCSHVLWQKILASKISIFHVFECALLLLFSSSAAAAAKLLQLCPTLCNPIDGSPWGSPVPGILQARLGCHFLLQCMKVKSESEVAQSCPTLSDPMDYSLSGSSIHGIFQARVLEWGAIAFSTLAHCVPLT